jgi:RimJ/RimL family protein N-acetyltransferase
MKAADVVLREVTQDDVAVFYEHQREPEGSAMAAFPMRERDAHNAHWSKIMRHGSVIARTIVAGGEVAGNIGSWEQDGERLVGYWVGKTFWGRGVATTALRLFVDDVEHTRPLRAHVAVHNLGSIRVLEKCGFLERRRTTGSDGVEEVVFERST